METVFVRHRKFYVMSVMMEHSLLTISADVMKKLLSLMGSFVNLVQLGNSGLSKSNSVGVLLIGLFGMESSVSPAGRA